MHLRVQPTVASVAMSGGLTRDELHTYVESRVTIFFVSCTLHSAVSDVNLIKAVTYWCARLSEDNPIIHTTQLT